MFDWKKIASAIPFKRMLLYFAIVLCIPFVFIGYRFLQKKKEWDLVASKIITLHQLSDTKAKKQALNNYVKELHHDMDHFYLANQVEPLRFLKREKEAMENLMQNPSFTGNEAAEKRYNFITDGRNKLHFTEAESETEEGLLETTEVLTHAVEIDAQDLKEILFRIETPRPGRPLLIITDFKLAKKEQTWGSEVFELNLKLLKREFLQ